MSYFLSEDAIRSKLEHLFPCLIGIGGISCDNFDADFVFRISKENGFVPQLESISFWDAFQNSNLSFDKEFEELIFSDVSENYTYAIISEMLGKRAVCFIREEADNIFNNATGIDFFQPIDYMIINLDLHKIIVIHHSGYLFQLECK